MVIKLQNYDILSVLTCLIEEVALGCLVKLNIEVFDSYFTEATNKERILAFIREQHNCDTPKTRNIALDFLRKWGILLSISNNGTL
jgi:hypothetical protein